MIPKLLDQPRVPGYGAAPRPTVPRPAPQPVAQPAPQQAPRPMPRQPAPTVAQPSEFDRVASRLTKANVTARQIEHYMKSGRFKSPEHAGAAAATDNIWADEAKTAGALTGDPLQDKLVWEKHWQFNRGRVPSDPLLDMNPQALEKIAARAAQVIQEMQRQPTRVPKLTPAKTSY